MKFEDKKFVSASIDVRRGIYECKPFKAFSTDGDCTLEIRGLLGIEFCQIEESKRGNDNAEQLINALMGSNDKTKLDAVKDILGIDSGFSDGYVKRLNSIMIGVVKPKLSRDVVTKLAKYYILDFWALGNAILNLTDDGGVVKPPGSGKSPKSEKPLHSGKSGIDRSLS